MSKGNLKYYPEANAYCGAITSYHMNMPIKLVPRDGDLSNNAPTHKVIGKAPAGHEFDAGVAWEGRVEKGANVGKSYFNIKIDDPAEMVVNAWPSNIGGEFDIELPREQQDSATGQTSTSQTNEDAQQAA